MRPIAIRSHTQAAGLLAGETRLHPGQPYAPGGDGAHEHAGCFGTILGTGAVARVMGWLGVGQQTPGQPARLNFRRRQGPGSLIPPRPFVELRQKPSGRFAKCFRSPISLFHVVNSSRRSDGSGVEEGQAHVFV